MTSQINPNNIDGNYPVAGVPNNTQGFRDNFTNTKTNFQYASDEISELQTKAVLKAALEGTTLDNNMNDQEIYAAKLRDTSYAYVALTATSGSISIDYTAGPYQQINPTGACSLQFINWPAAGSAGSIKIGFNVTNVSQTLTLPAAVSVGVVGVQGISPGTPGVSNTITFGEVGNYAFEFETIDSGTTIWLFDLSRPADSFSSAVTINSGTVSTSTSSGALVVDGGVGIGGNLYVGGAIVGAITVTSVSVTGNVVGGNINTAGVVSATGNIRGGNVNTAGAISAVGNIAGGNLLSTTLSLSGNVISTLNVTGNINGGNIKSPGVISAAGNVTGGNLITLGALSTSGCIVNSSISTTGNVTAAGNVLTGNLVATANVYAEYVQAINVGNTGNLEIESGGTYWYFNTDNSFTGNGNIIISSTGSITTNGTGKIGYGTGAGGTVTQATNKSTGVTLNHPSGEITMAAGSLSGGGTVSFTLTNSTIANTDVMIINQVGGANISAYQYFPVCNSGTANITVVNRTNSGKDDQMVLRYVVIKGATS